MATLRTKETTERYRKDKMSHEWDPETYVFDWEDRYIELFEHWALILANYPYDKIAARHDLLVPKRIFPTYKEVNEEEYKELKEIKEFLKDRYDFVLENLPSQITISGHYHLHFIKMREDI